MATPQALLVLPTLNNPLEQTFLFQINVPNGNIWFLIKNT